MTDIERKELADLVFPNLEHDVSYYEERYPKRDLKEGAMVTRYAPSPTGSVHLGNLLSAFADMVYAKQSGGSFYLRIEDTDQKRMMEGGIENITGVLHDFDIQWAAKKEGAMEKAIETARNFLFMGLSAEQVSEGTALPLETVKKLQSELALATQSAKGNASLGKD